MQTISPSEFKRGLPIMAEGIPHVIEEFHSSGTAQTRHKLHVKLRNLKSGRLVEKVFVENDRVPLAEVSTRRVQFSYKQGDTFVFLDTESYETLEVTAEQIGDRHQLLKEEAECKVLFWEGKLMTIELPGQVALRVKETTPPQKGGTDATWKPAILETGLEVMVPLFIAQGDLLRIDTQTRKYMGKESV
jgi:elongation factor P